MNRRNAERHPRETSVGEIHHPLTHRAHIEEGELVLLRRRMHTNPRGFSQLVEVTKPVGREQFEDGQAARAAEVLFPLTKRRALARQTAVKASGHRRVPSGLKIRSIRSRRWAESDTGNAHDSLPARCPGFISTASRRLPQACQKLSFASTGPAVLSLRERIQFAGRAIVSVRFAAA